MRTILVVANETLGGRALLDAVRERGRRATSRFVLCVPQNQPARRPGGLRRRRVRRRPGAGRPGARVRPGRGDRGDRRGRRPRPVHGDDGRRPRVPPRRDHHLDLPGDPLGLAAPRPDRARPPGLGRCRSSTSSPTPTPRGCRSTSRSPSPTARASGDELLEALKAKATPRTRARTAERLFIVVVPQEGGDGQATRRARTRLKLVLDRLHEAGPVRRRDDRRPGSRTRRSSTRCSTSGSTTS